MSDQAQRTLGPWLRQGRYVVAKTGDRILMSLECDAQGLNDLALAAAAPELLSALKILQANPNDPRADRKSVV
jgi:hypothetical protein